jgi:hypothetical protein
MAKTGCQVSNQGGVVSTIAAASWPDNMRPMNQQLHPDRTLYLPRDA